MTIFFSLFCSYIIPPIEKYTTYNLPLFAFKIKSFSDLQASAFSLGGIKIKETQALTRVSILFVARRVALLFPVAEKAIKNAMIFYILSIAVEFIANLSTFIAVLCISPRVIPFFLP